MTILSKFGRTLARSRSASPSPATSGPARSFSHLRPAAAPPASAHDSGAGAKQGIDAASGTAEFILQADRMRRGEIPVAAATPLAGQAAFIIAADKARRGEK